MRWWQHKPPKRYPNSTSIPGTEVWAIWGGKRRKTSKDGRRNGYKSQDESRSLPSVSGRKPNSPTVTCQPQELSNSSTAISVDQSIQPTEERTPNLKRNSATVKPHDPIHGTTSIANYRHRQFNFSPFMGTVDWLPWGITDGRFSQRANFWVIYVGWTAWSLGFRSNPRGSFLFHLGLSYLLKDSKSTTFLV